MDKLLITHCFSVAQTLLWFLKKSESLELATISKDHNDIADILYHGLSDFHAVIQWPQYTE